MKQRRIQIIEITVPHNGAQVKIDTRTNIEYDEVYGILARLEWGRTTYKTSLELKIDGEEIFPKDFEVDMITATSFNSYREVMYPVKAKAKNSLVEGIYKDGGTMAAQSFPYKVKLYLFSYKNV